MKRKILTLALATAAIGLSAPAMADPIPTISNLDGTLMPFNGFDWAQNGTAISTPISSEGLSVGDTFDTYYFAAAVAITSLPGGNPFDVSKLTAIADGTSLGDRYQYTVVASFQEKVDSIDVDTGTVNFSTTGGSWSVYYDHADLAGTRGNMMNGTGFDDGVRILWGDVDVQTIGFFNPNTSGGQFDFNGTVTGTDTTYINPEMKSTVAFGTLQFGPNETGWVTASGRPNGGGSATTDGLLEALQFQADGNQSFKVKSTDVPEPGVLALFGLGLFGLFATTRRKNNLVA